MGLFSGITKVVGGVIKKIAPSVIPGGGLIKTAVNIGGSALKKLGRKNMKKIVAGAAVGVGAAGAALKRAAATRTGAAVMGAGGGAVATELMMGMGGPAPRGGFGRRRINPGNIKAMRRAIRRVESGARLFSKFFAMKSGGIKGARGVRVKKFKIRRAA